MQRDGPRETDARRYRNDYLKLRSVLFDRTTGLPTFPVLFDRLRAMLEVRRRIGVLHLEIDNLRLVESLYGWQVFDGILSRVAEVLAASVGEELPEGSLLALNGVSGDRFAAFIEQRPDGSEVDSAFLEERARALAARLETELGDDAFAGVSPRLGFSAGHALLTQNPFYRFERRVYSALDQARSFLERRAQRREISWGEEIQQIVEDSAVETVFQPVVDLQSGAVLGHEAFSRGPKDSPLEMPRAMFATSRRCGIAAELDRVCREAALRASAGMEERGVLFLNVTTQGLRELRGADGSLGELLASVALRPGDLVLELSERGADEDPEEFIARLGGLKQSGFRIALDDVGTGYAGQAILERARPDYLKLDVSLVRDIHEHLIKQELMHSLVRIAGQIGAAVIAEGIESEEEAAALRAGGARYGQGFLFAAPAPASLCSTDPPAGEGA